MLRGAREDRAGPDAGGADASPDLLVEAALRAIDAAEERSRYQPPVSLSDEYRRLIAEVEALPENQDGADKSWVWRSYEYFRRHFCMFEID